MRIGIMGTRGIPNRYGGFEQCAQFLAEGLTRKGHQVFVYNSSLHPFKEDHFGDVTIIHCKEPHWLGTAGQFVYDRRCLKDASQQNFDILFHLGYTSDSVFYRLWSGSCIHVTNMDGMEWKRSKYNWLTRKFLLKAESLAANKSDLLIADSIPVKEHLVRKFGKEASFIPYGAEIFQSPDPTVIQKFEVEPGRYGILVARMEPENNIAVICESWISTNNEFPLLVVSNDGNAFGRKLKTMYQGNKIRFTGPIYDPVSINNLRYYSSHYFHGHSVGGTNPSLLEAMACSCNIIAHENPFNRAVLGNDGYYFSGITDLQNLLLDNCSPNEEHKRNNLDKIRTIYNWEKIVDSYEQLMWKALHRTA